MEKQRKRFYEAPLIEVVEMKLTQHLLDASLSGSDFESVDDGGEWN